MKKSLLFFSALSFFMSASAQITLNTSDVAGVNKVVYQATDTLISSNAIVGFAGASQTWNMTAITEDVKDTLTFLPYSAAPNATFSSANLIMQPGSGNTYLYANNSSSSLTVLGITTMIGASPVTQTVTPPEVLLNFPFTFNNSFSSNYQTYQKFYFGLFGIDSARQKSDVKKTVLADAWGSLSTPYTTAPVLRLKETIISRDTTDVLIGTTWYNAFITSADSTTSYTWWAKTIGFPLAKATMDSLGGVSSMEWLKGTGTVGVLETAAAVPGINVYPNPTQSMIHFDITALEATSVRVYDINGRFIHEYPVKNNRSSFNTIHFADGIYTYSVIGEENEILKQGKFTVSK